METKHAFRLLVTPGALLSLVAGFLGGLLWLGLTSQPAVLARTDVASLAAARPLLAPSSGRVALQDAINSVRHLAGQPGLLLEGGMQADDGAARASRLYYLESVSPTRGDDLFKVDARTGEVVEATFRGRMAPAEPPANLTFADAEARAAAFARANFWGFDGLVLVDRAARAGEHGTVYTFRWSKVAAESNAELPTSVSVAIMAQNGQVFWYLSQRDPLTVSVRPAVGAEQAVATARAWLLPRDDRWDLGQPLGTRLQVLYDDDDRQRLLWSVTFKARSDEGPRASIRLLIDAQSGQLVRE